MLRAIADVRKINQSQRNCSTLGMMIQGDRDLTIGVQDIEKLLPSTKCGASIGSLHLVWSPKSMAAGSRTCPPPMTRVFFGALHANSGLQAYFEAKYRECLGTATLGSGLGSARIR